MSSIMSQNLYQRVTTDFQVRKIQKIDPTKFTKSVLQVSDQQSRDKDYQKSIEYLRTYIASLQAKLNTLVEELNNNYDTMLNEMLYKKADSKDTAKQLNKVPNADLTDSCSNTAKYNLRDLEITPYDKNVRFYKYNSLFGSKGLDLSNYYNYGQTNNTSIARSYYEKSDPSSSSPSPYHELGASVFGTLDYLWKWDLDRVNATYATTKDVFIDKDGTLHVPPGDPRLGSAGVIADDNLSVAGAGGSTTSNTLQVNVTDLQPNRGVFLPGEEKPTEQVDLLKTTGEEKNPLANWITTYENSGSHYISDSANYIRNNYTPDKINPNEAGLSSKWDGINQWGVDDTPPILNNALQSGIPFVGTPDSTGAGYIGGAGYIPTSATDSTPLADYSTNSTPGYQSKHSIHFGNIRQVTYNDIVYAPHSTYYFRPDMINEHFNGDVGNTGTALTNTNDPNWAVTGNATLVKSNTSYDTGATYQTNPIPGYLNGGSVSPLPRNVLDMSYGNTTANGSVDVSTAKFNLSEFEDVNVKFKQFYNVSPYGQKWIHDTNGDYGDTDLDTIMYEKSIPSVQLVANLTGTSNSNVFTSDTTAQTSRITLRGYATDQFSGKYFTTPKPITTENQFKDVNFNLALGTANMGLDFKMNEVSNPRAFNPTGSIAGTLIEWKSGGNPKGRTTTGTPAADPMSNLIDLPSGTQISTDWQTVTSDYILGNNLNITGSGINLKGNPPAPFWGMWGPGWGSGPGGRVFWGAILDGTDFRRGYTSSPFFSSIPLDGPGTASTSIGATPLYYPTTGTRSLAWGGSSWSTPYNGSNLATADQTTSTRWQLDDIKLNAMGFTRGEMISPPLDLSKMEGGTLEFMDRIETSTDKIEHKEIYYSFDYDENNPSAATWVKLKDKNEINNQDWTKNTLDIPCSGGKNNVRVKFVFDTRKNTKIRNNGLNNFAKNTDHDGWNLDNIRVYGTKINPSDFIYYRQDLNSEFVTGMGPRDVNVTTLNAGFVDPWTNFTETVTPNGSLTNTASTVTQSATDSLVFSNTPISTVVPPTNVALTNTISNTMGVVTHTIAPGPYYGPIIAATIPGHSPTDSDPLGSIYIPAGSIIITPNPLVNIPTSDITYNPLTGRATNLMYSPVSITYKSPIAAGPTRTLNWDVTGSVTPTASNTYTVNFNANKVTYPANSATNNILVTDPWSNIFNSAGQPIVTVPLSMENDPTASPYALYESITPAKSVVEIPAINLTGLATAKLNFNYTGTNSSVTTTRQLDIVDSSGNILKTFTYGGVGGTTPINVSIDLAPFIGMTGLKFRFTTDTDGLRINPDSALDVWNITDLALSTAVPPVTNYTSSRTSGVYHINPTDTHTKFSFDYIATDDNLANIGRNVTMYTSPDGFTWDAGAKVLIDPPATGVVTNSGPISVPEGKYVKFGFDTTIDLSAGVNLPVISNLFNISNAKMTRYAGENYNQSESANFPSNINRPNISFDSRKSNIEGKYTVVNNRTQITNSDFPMFSNTLLSYVEQDPAKLQAQRSDTYAEWLGTNNSTPARVLSVNYGYVNPQTTQNPVYVLSSDGLNQYYEADVNGNLANMYVDDALAINTGKMTKTATLSQINTDKTGWVNASVNPTTGGIWLPYVAGTKYDEGNGTYRNMTTWAKKTFLSDPASISNPTLNISSNDDSYLYVNGYNVKSTAYSVTTAATTNTVNMIDTSDYAISPSANSYIMINGEIAQVISKTATSLTIQSTSDLTTPPLSTTNVSTIGNFGTASKSPATVYHANTAKDRLGNVIQVVSGGTIASKSLVLNSVDLLSTGQTIYVNNQPVVISSVNISTKTITFNTPLNSIVGANSPILTGFVDAGAATNTAPVLGGTSTNTTSFSGGRTVLNTNDMSAISSFNVQPLLRASGFNTIGVKATEDRGLNEGFKLTATGMKAVGDTFSSTGGASGIDSDSRWSVKVSPNGYDGNNPYFDGITWSNDPAPPLSAQEITDLFKTEKQNKAEMTLHFINQNPNGVGKVSQIKNIEINATGEPTVQTFKTTNYSTDSANTTADSNIVTQMTKGYVNGIEQNGGQQSLVFNTGTNLGYSTSLDGKADINLFINKDDNIVNDATLNVKVDYYEDTDGDGVISGAEATTLKTRYIGMQDLRNNIAVNSLSTAPSTPITGLIDRYKYVSSTGTATQGTNTITVANAADFKIGDGVKIDVGGGKQSFTITNIVGNTLTLSSNILLSSGSATVNTYNILSEVNSTVAQSMYEGTTYTVDGNTIVNSQYLVASKGRNGGADAGAGNENKISKRIKQILDGDEFQEMLKYGLLDGVYIAATASDNRGDQIVGKLMLDWDWRRKRIAVKQGSFSAIYKS